MNSAQVELVKSIEELQAKTIDKTKDNLSLCDDAISLRKINHGLDMNTITSFVACGTTRISGTGDFVSNSQLVLTKRCIDSVINTGLTLDNYDLQYQDDNVSSYNIGFKSAANKFFRLNLLVQFETDTLAIVNASVLDVVFMVTSEKKHFSVKTLLSDIPTLQKGFNLQAIIAFIDRDDLEAFNYQDLAYVQQSKGKESPLMFVTKQHPHHLIDLMLSGLLNSPFVSNGTEHQLHLFKEALKEMGCFTDGAINLDPLLRRYNTIDSLCSAGHSLENLFVSCEKLGIAFDVESAINACIDNIRLNNEEHLFEILLDGSVLNRISPERLNHVDWAKIDTDVINTPSLMAFKLKHKAKELALLDTISLSFNSL